MKKSNNNQTLPKHLAFIMDGNRRWARAHKFEFIAAHSRGAERIETIVEAAAKEGIAYTTFWAFSTENWNREKDEVATLMNVFRNLLSGPIVGRMIAKGVKLQIIGDYQVFSSDIVDQCNKLMEASRDNTKIIANIALNYGGRAEIVRTVNDILKEKRNSASYDEDIDDQTFSSHLHTKGQPDPDMIVRTGGAQRLSGFLPWQSVYSELYFTDTLWPDFDETEFEKVLKEFGRRQRRFGK